MKGRNWETGLDVEFEFFSLPRQAQIFPLPLAAVRVCSCRDCGLPPSSHLSRRAIETRGRKQSSNPREGTRASKKVVWQPERHIDKGH